MGSQSPFAEPSRFVDATKLIQHGQTHMHPHENSRLTPWHAKHAEFTHLNRHMIELTSLEGLRRFPNHAGRWILNGTRNLLTMADLQYFKGEAHKSVAIINDTLIFIGQIRKAKNVLVVP